MAKQGVHLAQVLSPGWFGWWWGRRLGLLLPHSLQQKLDQSRWPLPSLDHMRKKNRDKGTLWVFKQLEMTRKVPLARHRKVEAFEETELDP